MGTPKALLDLVRQLPSKQGRLVHLAFGRCHLNRGWWLVATSAAIPLPVAAGFLFAGGVYPAPAALLFLLVNALSTFVVLRFLVRLAWSTFARRHIQTTAEVNDDQARVTVIYPTGRFQALVASFSPGRFWRSVAVAFLLISLPITVLLILLVRSQVGPGGLLFREPRILEGRVLSHTGFWTPGPGETIPKPFQGHLLEGIVPKGTLAASRGLTICSFPTDSDEQPVPDPPEYGGEDYQRWLDTHFNWTKKAVEVVGKVTLSVGRAHRVGQGDLFHVLGGGTVKATVLVYARFGEEAYAVPITLVPFQTIQSGDLAIRIREYR